MSEPIKVGDLVMVVKACCSETVRSPVFTVSDFDWKQPNSELCSFCKAPIPAEPHASDRSGPWHVYPVSWLKKIPPLSELDDVKHDEEITA